MNILITGAKGQLGKCIQDLAQNYPDLNFEFTDTSELDISNKKEIKDFFENGFFNYCINCAAYTAVDKAENDFKKASDVNSEAVKYLAEECKKNNVVLVHISTDFVFDGSKTTLYNENDLPNPINVYGKSKLTGEQYVQDILKDYFIVRTSWVFSEYGNNFLKTMLRLGDEREELNVVCDQIGTPTYAGDLAEVLLEIVSDKNDSFGIYHYSNEGVASWYDFAMAIFEESEIKVRLRPIRSVQYPTPAKRPSFSVLSKEKIKKKLDIEIPYWKQSLKTCLKQITN